MATALTPIEDNWTGEGVSSDEIERELARLRDTVSQQSSQPNLRTSVMTHLAWVPPQWQVAAEETLAGMAERHPSRTLLMVPLPDAPENRIDAQLSIRCFPIGDRAVCGEVVELALRGPRAKAPASIALPLLISDLPVFLRWRGEPPFGSPELDQMVAITDRLIVDSEEWAELRYVDLATLFERTAVSDIAWRRTEAWRVQLASYWPGIAEQEIRVRGPRAEATLLSAWLGARLDRPMRAIEPADELGVRLGNEELPEPRRVYETPSDLLSAELDQFGRNRVYEEAVRAAAG
ncbi:MAG: glucose-6-phosphate dehydrogenase assembly protein OpcA [Gaiellaceae bacterium]